MKQMRLGQTPPKSHDWVMGNSASRGNGYTKEEVEFVKKNYLKYSDQQLSEILKRTIWGITGLRSRNRLLRERKLQFKVLLKIALREAETMRSQWIIIQDMKALIIMCELEQNAFKRDRYKNELRRLSGC